MHRKRRTGPEVLIPAVAEDPRIGRRSRECGGALDDLCVRTQVNEGNLGQEEADARQVDVRVDQSRQHREARNVEHFGRGTAERHRTRARTDVDEAAVANRERLRRRVTVIYRMNRIADDDQVGAARRPARRGGRSRRRQETT